MRVSPDGRLVFVSLAHGTPFGKLWSYDTANGELADVFGSRTEPLSEDVTEAIEKVLA